MDVASRSRTPRAEPSAPQPAAPSTNHLLERLGAALDRRHGEYDRGSPTSRTEVEAMATSQQLEASHAERNGVPPGPLAGMRVIEWAHAHMGPAGGTFLGDMGADVIHVETPGAGDMMRHHEGTWGVRQILPDGRNAIFEDLSRNKRSLAVDLKKPEGRRIVHELVRDADVFLTNMRPAAVEKLELDYETLAKLNPRLVYCAGTSFGERGPDKDSPGLEMMGLARSGMLFGSALQGEPP